MITNIVHIVQSLDIGGLERVVVDLVTHRFRKDFHYVVFCLEDQGPFVHELRIQGIDVICFDKKKGWDFSLFFRIAYLLRKKRITIVHTHNSGPLLYGGIAARIVGIPFVIHTKHGTNLRQQRNDVWLNAILFKIPDKIIAVSQDALLIAHQKEKVPFDKLIYIPNGVDTKKFSITGTDSVSIRKKYNLPNDDFLVGIVARLCWEKDIPTLLEAFRLILQEKKDVSLVVVGDGAERSLLETIVRKCDIGRHVFFLGMQHDIPELLSLFTVFSLPSIREGMPVTLLEAMAMQIPVVVTDVGANREIVEHGVSGYVVKQKDVVSLKDAIMRLIYDREMAAMMGKKGREKVSDEYSVDSMVEKYEKEYGCVMKSA